MGQPDSQRLCLSVPLWGDRVRLPQAAEVADRPAARSRAFLVELEQAGAPPRAEVCRLMISFVLLGKAFVTPQGSDDFEASLAWKQGLSRPTGWRS